MRTVFSKVSTILPSDARMIMGRLVDAYTACQAEQGRVVDAREYGLIMAVLPPWSKWNHRRRLAGLTMLVLLLVSWFVSVRHAVRA